MRFCFMLLLVLCTILTSINSSADEILLYSYDTPDLAKVYGYHGETHTVTTEDGYILTVHRIYKTIKLRPPVLLVHGALSSSTDWVNMGPKRALALILADIGFDVWMVNFRGNTYSRKHATIQPVTDYSYEFWDFTFHEQGVYDLPATVDYILNKTNEVQLNYIGHSLGTTSFYVMCSVVPEYQKKIHLMISLAPVVYVKLQGASLLLSKYIPEIAVAFAVNLKSYAIWTDNNQIPACSDIMLKISKEICADLISYAVGYDPYGLDLSTLDVIFSHYPAGTSTKTYIHEKQIIDSDNFIMFDYGKSSNLQKYGQDTPPAYNLSGIEVPIVIVWAENDKVSTEKDVDRLEKELPNVIERYKVPYEKFNHVDYMWGYKVNKELYSYIIRILIKCSKIKTENE